MKRIVILLLTACLLGGCQVAQPELYVSVNADCSKPCWYGITPGKSTQVETETWLRSLTFVSNLDFQAPSSQGVTRATWQFTPNTAFGYAVFKSSVLQQLIFRPRGLHLGDVLDRLGAPDYISAGYEPGETVGYDLILYYPKKGVVVIVADKPVGGLDDAQRITRDLNVAEIQYFAPTDVATYLTKVDGRSSDSAQSVLDHLQHWPGYGPNVVHVGR